MRAIHEDESTDCVSLGINRQAERLRDPSTGKSKINGKERRYLVALLPNFEQGWIPRNAALDSITARTPP
jgi:hypothetical protein